MAHNECLNCGKPAVQAGPVPLCADCKALAKGQERGVKYAPRPTDDSQVSSSLSNPKDPLEVVN